MPSEARPTREGAGERPRSNAPRPLHAWNVLDGDRRLAAGAAFALFATMLLPWYQQNAVVSDSKTGTLVSQNLNAFAVFSFVEAAILLVAVAVLFLLYERAEGATFNLPGSDGAVIFAAGLWAALLLVLRLFDKPGVTHHGIAANVGVQWGIFFALAAAGLLAYAGSRMRATRRPEPPLVRHERSGTAGEPRRRRVAPETVVAPEDEPTVAAPRHQRPAGRPRSPYPPAPPDAPTALAEQLSFEDAPPEAR